MVRKRKNTPPITLKIIKQIAFESSKLISLHLYLLAESLQQYIPSQLPQHIGFSLVQNNSILTEFFSNEHCPTGFV